MSQDVVVVGIGADGWRGLAAAARDALTGAEVILGGSRQLELLPATLTAARVAWPSPLLPALPGLLAEQAGRRVAVLASGDPTWFGIAKHLPGAEVLPHPSSLSLACARLGWAMEDVEVISAVGRPLSALAAALAPGRRVLVLVPTGAGAAEVTALLLDHGYGTSRVTALAQLGGPDETITDGPAPHDPLAIVAVACAPDPSTAPLPRTPGLPDDAFAHDGQITKWEIRAVTLAALAPVPGQQLWDVGAGSGSVAIEWCRVHPSLRAVAVEPRADRRERITHNAERLGVPGIRVVAGRAPDALADLPPPDAVFVGGGVSVPGVLEMCVSALRPGGRLVANGVTLETEAVLRDWHAKLGGALLRLAVERAEPIGGFTGFTPARTVTQWSYRP